MTAREWKKEVAIYIFRARKWENSNYRQEREYAAYVKRFLFGDGEFFDCNNETWKKRKAERSLPMPVNVYLYM